MDYTNRLSNLSLVCCNHDCFAGINVCVLFVTLFQFLLFALSESKAVVLVITNCEAVVLTVKADQHQGMKNGGRVGQTVKRLRK